MHWETIHLNITNCKFVDWIKNTLHTFTCVYDFHTFFFYQQSRHNKSANYENSSGWWTKTILQSHHDFIRNYRTFLHFLSLNYLKNQKLLFLLVVQCVFNIQYIYWIIWGPYVSLRHIYKKLIYHKKINIFWTSRR